jgi:ABC-type transporter Mla MlaB component
MLKIISDASGADGAPLLRLEGQVAGRWVAELRHACGQSLTAAASTLTIDLRNVTFIDAAGVALFDEVFDQVTFINCSLFAAEQLKAIATRRLGRS